MWAKTEPEKTALTSLGGLDMLVLAWGFALATGGARVLNGYAPISALVHFGAYLLLGFFLLAMYISICQVLSKENSRGLQVCKALLALAAITLFASLRYR